MKYELRYSEWRETTTGCTFSLVLLLDAIEIGRQQVALPQNYSPQQMLAAVRAASQTIKAGPQGKGEPLLQRILAMENAS